MTPPGGSAGTASGSYRVEPEPYAPKTGRVVCRECGIEVTLCLSGHVKHVNDDRSHRPRSVAERVAW